MWSEGLIVEEASVRCPRVPCDVDDSPPIPNGIRFRDYLEALTIDMSLANPDDRTAWTEPMARPPARSPNP